MAEQRYVTLKGGPLDGCGWFMTGPTLSVARPREEPNGPRLKDVYQVDSSGLTATYAGAQDYGSGEWIQVASGGGVATVSGLV